MHLSPSPLWQPSRERSEATRMAAFQKFVAERLNLSLTSEYWDLYRWSLQQPEAFWSLAAEYLGIIWQQPPVSVFKPGKGLAGGQWFPGATLNYAQNLLRNAGDTVRVISYAEGRPVSLRKSGRDLHNAVARCAAALAACGVGKGDRVAGVLANSFETLVAMLATSSLGAIWSSCSPDFGVAGVLDRLKQVEPKVLFYTPRYQYGGRLFDCGEATVQILADLPSVKTAVAVPLGLAADAAGEASPSFAEFLATQSLQPDADGLLPLTFTPVPFDHPLFIMFSSGTTGVPKCIVHGVGGTLLQHKKELALHTDLRPEDRLLYYTTCGWMMWNWMASALSLEATLVLYEGSVTYPDLGQLWRIIAEEKVRAFGTSPKFLATCMTVGLRPGEKWDLSGLRIMLSTGSPLLPDHFHWVYQNVGGDLHLASISGGTDIISCFMLGVPTLPVYSGEIQAPGLGMAVAAWDDEGSPVVGQKGELVCTQPFPSMPVGFWNDPDGSKYHSAYFEHYQHREVWRHGDYIEVTPRGGIVVYGRSDATLNPGGVRIGTAEIYRQVEQHPEVLDSLAVGKEFGGDIVIWLFVKLAEGKTLDENLVARIKTGVRSHLTARHVPKRIFAVKEIPYTRSGKKVEIAVREAVNGLPVKNINSLANPDCLSEYYAIGEQNPGKRG